MKKDIVIDIPAKSIKAFAKLIETYKSITVEKIEKLMTDKKLPRASDALSLITGFGKTGQSTLYRTVYPPITTKKYCTLCKATKFQESDEYNCFKCAWAFGCNIDNTRNECLNDSYYAIEEAKTSKSLISNIKKRVRIMEKHLKKINKSNSNG